MSDLTLSDMLALRKQVDPDAPDMIVFPESPVTEREQIARMVERMYGPHDRRFKTAMEIINAIRTGADRNKD